MTVSGRIIADGEHVYRRIPLAWWPNPKEGYPKIDAFLPHTNDVDGLSVEVASLTTIEKSVSVQPPRPYHLCCLSVGVLRSKFGLSVLADPQPGNPAHAIVPELNRASYDRDKLAMKGIADRIVRALIEAENPLGHFVRIALPDRG
jgi:hypothetical protein